MEKYMDKINIGNFYLIQKKRNANIANKTFQLILDKYEPITSKLNDLTITKLLLV